MPKGSSTSTATCGSPSLPGPPLSWIVLLKTRLFDPLLMVTARRLLKISLSSAVESLAGESAVPANTLPLPRLILLLWIDTCGTLPRRTTGCRQKLQPGGAQSPVQAGEYQVPVPVRSKSATTASDAST